ncbi:unnamed protein product [Boreogadus saida]
MQAPFPKTQDDVPRKAGPTRATAGPEGHRAAFQSQLQQIAVQPAVGIKKHGRGSVEREQVLLNVWANSPLVGARVCCEVKR